MGDKTSVHSLILAAGLGKRMKSEVPKVLHPVLFRPMLSYVLDVANEVGSQSISVVVGHGENQVREACADLKGVEFFRQEKQLGTADAVKSAMPFVSKQKGTVLVLCGDVCLLRKESLFELMRVHREKNAKATILTGKVVDPTGYGRILRHSNGNVVGIREERDASVDERSISEVNSGIYCFEIDALNDALKRVTPKNAQGEYYLTDVIEILVGANHVVAATCLEDSREMTGVNDRAALCEVETIMRRRVNHHFMMSGVTMHSPDTITIDPRCKIAPDVEVGAGSEISKSEIESGVKIEPSCHIISSVIRRNAHLKQGTYIENSEVGEEAAVGPYAHLRPGSHLGKKVKIGNFVELKKAVMKDGAKASHLSYIGDAEIGENSNLGCGFITCNFDGGPKKHRTVIESDVFVGSDSQTVAPVTIGRGSYVASGSTVTENVPADSLVISRGRQVTKPGYAKKYKK